jgi:hypothetical protein
MGFRVSAIDLASGKPVADYDTRAATADLAREEAARLGVRILGLSPLHAPVEAVPGSAPALLEWDEKPLGWSVRTWSLMRLGFEHPRWGAWLYRPLMVPLLLLKSKVLLKWFAASLASMLAMVGFDAPPAAIMLAMVPALLLGPLLLLSPMSLPGCAACMPRRGSTVATGSTSAKRVCRISTDDRNTCWNCVAS